MLARIKKIMTDKGYSPSLFADELDIPRSSISHLLAERNKPSLDIVLRILSKFPEVNSEWLLNGKGSVYKSDESNPTTSTPTPQPTIQYPEEKKSEKATVDASEIEKNKTTIPHDYKDSNTATTSKEEVTQQKKIDESPNTDTHISETKTKNTVITGNLFDQNQQEKNIPSQTNSQNNPIDFQSEKQIGRVAEEQHNYNVVRESEDPPIYNYRENTHHQKNIPSPQKVDRKIIRVITIYNDGTFEDFKSAN